ncbi:MAG: hypothetical protein K2O88_06470, partial [Paramuribaculum sp.]|nr:hypothetical protein [Paramuribaculum sp.]
MTNQYDRSRIYFNKIINDSPTANDYLNFGHLEMAQGNFREALSLYKESAKLLGNDTFKLKEMFNADRSDLIALGIDAFMIDLVADSL